VFQYFYTFPRQHISLYCIHISFSFLYVKQADFITVLTSNTTILIENQENNDQNNTTVIYFVVILLSLGSLHSSMYLLGQWYENCRLPDKNT